MVPVIIIGAPRSGTNMLRDVLCSFENICTWPCDEINYIWRHGNVRHPTDAISAKNATDSIAKYIRGSFRRIGRKYESDVVVEKTCANSLRVPFVDAILPEAKYIFIYRDGIDATGSAVERWTADLDIKYILDKARFVPVIDLPYYALRYLWARIYRLFSREKRLAFWGPIIENMDDIVASRTLNEISVLQWQSCVEEAERALAVMPAGKFIRVRYEDFVCQPSRELGKILAFIGVNADEHAVASAVKDVTASSIGKGRSKLGLAEVEELESLVKSTLRRLDYL